MALEIRQIHSENRADINIKNEPFKLYGRMIPHYDGKVWGYEIEHFGEDAISEMVFPDESYSFDEMSNEHIFIGAYDGDKCVGLAILKHSWNRYLYLYDLKVNKDYRGKGVGKRLIEACIAVSREHGYLGLHTIGQDNNLAACLFYVKNGFIIGGVDSMVYNGTSQAGKSDILFYKNN